MLKQIVQKLKAATGLPVYPLVAQKIEGCIVYSHSITNDDGAVSRQRLEVRIISFNMNDAEKHRKEVIRTMVPSGDNMSMDGLLACEVNGGGILKDDETETIHTILYFDLIVRSENK